MDLGESIQNTICGCSSLCDLIQTSVVSRTVVAIDLMVMLKVIMMFSL